MVKTTRELRESFLSYFESKGHRRDRSSSLIPHNDPTLLFTNAGMNQYKDIFTGQEKRSYTRATTVQKCVRAGGKHNDLEAVGFTRRHHTFFEMLGNFSFGDYFKKEAIEFAWEFLTKVIGFSEKDLWVSVFEKDDEAEALWLKISGLPKGRVVRMGEKDNFWAMGDTGPCGPCSEIYVDRGEAFGKDETIFDGGERYLEIWNLVFMQYERMPDGTLVLLPKPSVDTGMGLERLASVVQNVDSNYLTDSLMAILQGFSQQLNRPYGKNSEDDLALRVLTDHIRSVSFLIGDGVQPSNEGRGYVLRRILRRAIRYGKKLGCDRPFFHQGASYLEKEMGTVYPELSQNLAAIKKMIYLEEEKFFETLDHGLKLLESKTKDLKKGAYLPGAVAFQLYDTFGFPLDLTEVILREHGFFLDQAGFDAELEAQRLRSRSSWKGSGEAGVLKVYQQISARGLSTQFTGYSSLEEETNILTLIFEGKEVPELTSGQCGEVVLERSPFYPEGGGQVGDIGVLEGPGFLFHVSNSHKPSGSLVVVSGEVKSGVLRVNQSVVAKVDRSTRLKTRINHTITHVLHATLQQVLGEHVKQSGSLVRPDYLRFDFAHFQACSDEELERIEQIVNDRIRENASVKSKEEDLEKAVAGGAKAFFDEKYGDRVRVVSVGEFSKELCGGTHAEALGEAGLFKITTESSVASGVRRIVAVTGQKAIDYIRDQEKILSDLAVLLKASPKDLVARVDKLLKEKSELLKKASQSVAQPALETTELIKVVEGIKTIVHVAKADDAKDLRLLSDRLKQKIQSGVVVLGAIIEGKVTVLVSVTDDISSRFRMDQFVKVVSQKLDGRGGGKPTFAQIGCSNIGAFSEKGLVAMLADHLRT